MGTGIIVCGLNGAGKSTLGRALAEELGFCFIDAEELFFDSDDLTAMRTHEEANRLLMEKITRNRNFVLAAVKGDHGEEFYPYVGHIVYVTAPKDIRLARVKERSLRRFGSRMLEGGDLFERERSFFELVASRTEDEVEEWLCKMEIPVIRVEGTEPVTRNVIHIIKHIHDREA